MDNNTSFKPVKPTGRNVKKIALIAIGSIVIVGLIGYGTLALLKQFKAPTISNNSQSQSTTASTPPAKTPEQALKAADDAHASAVKKATSGDQKAALADYKTAYENYTAAHDTAKARDTKFAIDSINAALTAPQNPANPAGSKTSAKQ